MKKRELQEMKNKSVMELKKALSDLSKKKIDTEVKMGSGKESDLKAVSKIRRDISQILTLITIKLKDQKENAEKEADNK